MRRRPLSAITARFRKPQRVSTLLKNAHKLLLVSWSCSGAGCVTRSYQTKACLAECVVLANGQPGIQWDQPRGLAADAMKLLSDLIIGDDQSDPSPYPYSPARNVALYNDHWWTKLEHVSNLMVDAIAIAGAEERDELNHAIFEELEHA